MNRLDIFAQNLRSECARFESIAAVCRKANVNRQQFSKYLAGQSLPSAAVLRKICDALNVDEKRLFRQPLPDMAEVTSVSSMLSSSGLMKYFGDTASTISLTDTDFPTGNYYCYFLLGNVPGMVVRTFLQVKRSDIVVSFTRITILPSGRDGSALMSKGRHKGIILCNSSEYYFLGINRFAPNQLSFMSVERKNITKDKHFTGLAITRSGNASFAARFCIVPISSKLKIRDVFKTLGLIHQTELGAEAYVMVSLFQ